MHNRDYSKFSFIPTYLSLVNIAPLEYRDFTMETARRFADASCVFLARDKWRPRNRYMPEHTRYYRMQDPRT